jgi:predicted RNA-binding Zn-ribbon protein involved in translation (DUF1610 family)
VGVDKGLVQMKKVTEINATMITFDCPSCGATQEGFLSDPRGGLYKCEECGCEYEVAEKTRVVLQ